MNRLAAPMFYVVVAVLASCRPAPSNQAEKPISEPTQAALTEPWTRIGVQRTDGALQFELSSCDDPNGVATSWLAIASGGIVFCEIERESTNGPLVRHWVYGRESDGFHIKRCRTLETNRTYSVCSWGSGGGCAEFAIDEQGEPRMIKDGCDRD